MSEKSEHSSKNKFGLTRNLESLLFLHQESEKFTIGNVGSKRDLTIYDCRPDDEGIYEFIYEGSSTKAVLSVQGQRVCNRLYTLVFQYITCLHLKLAKNVLAI